MGRGPSPKLSHSIGRILNLIKIFGRIIKLN